MFHILERFMFQGLINEIKKIGFFYFMDWNDVANRKISKAFLWYPLVYVFNFFYVSWADVVHSIKGSTFLLKKKKNQKCFDIMQQSGSLYFLRFLKDSYLVRDHTCAFFLFSSA